MDPALRRARSAEEISRHEAWLAAHPEAMEAASDDAALNRVLDGLPNIPVSSNFTALVMQAVAAEQRKSKPAPVQRVWWPVMQRIASFTAAIAILGILMVQYQRSEKRAALARSVATVTASAPVPSVQALQDFEVINRLGQVAPPADIELLSALQ